MREFAKNFMINSFLVACVFCFIPAVCLLVLGLMWGIMWLGKHIGYERTIFLYGAFLALGVTINETIKKSN